MLDFGGQYSQLIARRIRECGVYAELLPARPRARRRSASARRRRWCSPAARRRSTPTGAPKLRRELLELGIPVLGICYGMQAMVLELGGRVEGAEAGEFGRTELTLAGDGGRLLAGPAGRAAVLDEPSRLGLRGARRASTALAASPGSPVAALEDTERGLYGIQFHPEVVHTPYGQQILDRFLREIAGCEANWSPASVIDEQVERIRAQVGDAGVICGLSGGVDSATAAALVHRAIGDQLTCVLVDHGLMRKNEADQVVAAMEELGVNLIHVDAEAALPRPARRGRRPRAQAHDHRRGVHPRVRGRGGEARRRRLPRPGHALLGRDRVRRRRAHRRHDQVAPQRRRPARGPRLRPGRAAADAVQGRGPRGRRRARPLRAGRLAPAVPRPGPRRSGSSAARSTASGSTSCATPTRSSRRRSRRRASTASSGSRSACCRWCARSASRATAAPTPTRS